MIRVYFAPFPHTDQDKAEAHRLGAQQLWDGVGGYQEINEPGDSLQEQVEAQCDQVDRVKDDKTNQGFLFNGVLFQGRPDDQVNINGAVQAALVKMTTDPTNAQPGNYRWQDPNRDFVWIAANNQLIPMDAPTVIQFFETGAARKVSLIFYALGLKNAIRAVQGINALNAIDINIGWP